MVCHAIANIKNKTIEFYNSLSSRDRVTSIYLGSTNNVSYNEVFDRYLRYMLNDSTKTGGMFCLHYHKSKKGYVRYFEYDAKHNYLKFVKYNGKVVKCLLSDFKEAYNKIKPNNNGNKFVTMRYTFVEVMVIIITFMAFILVAMHIIAKILSISLHQLDKQMTDVYIKSISGAIRILAPSLTAIK